MVNRKELESIIAETVKKQLEQAGTKEKFLTPEQLCDRWQISMRCLEKWRLQGKYPAYMKIQGGHQKTGIRYPLNIKNGILEVEERWLRSSTTDGGDDNDGKKEC